MPDKYINIHNLKVSESLSKFVEEELLTETDISSDKFWLGFQKTVNELEPKNRELIKIRDNLQKKVDDWDITEDKNNIFFLFKKFKFENFIKSQNFVNEVGRISEEEGHHPDISFGWGYAEIKITTHAIKGLSENDFILAAKIDQLINV